MREVTKCHVGRWVMGSTPLGYCWFIYKIGARTGRLTGQFETYAQPIASSPAISLHLDRLLEKAVDAATDDRAGSTSAVWDELDAQHHALWSEARTQHQQRTRELAAYRGESLSTSHQVRLALLQEQLEQAADEKLQRMRRSQIDTAQADYERRIQELDRAMERADIIAEPVAYGVLVVEGN